MRILVVSNLYPPHHFGGYEDLCAGAVANWRAAGHHVEVLAGEWHRPDTPTDAPAPDGERVQRLLPLYWADHRMLTPGLRESLDNERRARAVVESVLDEVRPDVVSVWNLAALSFGVLAYTMRREIPVVLVVGDFWLSWGARADGWARWFERGGFAGRVAGAAVTAVTGLAARPGGLDGVIACFCSAHVRDRALSTGRWSFAATPVIGFGVDLQRYPIVPRKTGPWRGQLLYVGRLDPRKGIATAIRSVAALDGETLTVIGGGDQVHRGALERLATDLGVGDRVFFHGEGAPPDIRAACAAADALVFPSEWDEPFGIVPLEAMTQGVPVVATGSGGSGEFLVDGLTAVLFSRGEPEALASAIRRLADDDELRGRLVRNGRTTASWLSRDRSSGRLLEWHVAAADGSLHAILDDPMVPPDLER